MTAKIQLLLCTSDPTLFNSSSNIVPTKRDFKLIQKKIMKLYKQLLQKQRQYDIPNFNYILYRVVLNLKLTYLLPTFQFTHHEKLKQEEIFRVCFGDFY